MFEEQTLKFSSRWKIEMNGLLRFLLFEKFLRIVSYGLFSLYKNEELTLMVSSLIKRLKNGLLWFLPLDFFQRMDSYGPIS